MKHPITFAIIFVVLYPVVSFVVDAMSRGEANANAIHQCVTDNLSDYASHDAAIRACARKVGAI